jgi:FixJ family two-component response regulator
MPELTGTDLAREIRRSWSDIPIVLMGGFSGERLTERAHAAGVRDVLRKPLVSRDIAEPLTRSPPGASLSRAAVDACEAKTSSALRISVRTITTVTPPLQTEIRAKPPTPTMEPRHR